MTTNDGGPAFPRTRFEEDPNDELDVVLVTRDGMSLRDWFAGRVSCDDITPEEAAAVMGEFPPQWSSGIDFDHNLKCVKWWATACARYRLIHANAMIAEREAKP